MPVTFQNWIQQSSKFGLRRSPELQRVDQCVGQYNKTKSESNLTALALAILDWRNSKANWTVTSRANEMKQLINLVKAEAQKTAHPGGRYVFSFCHCSDAATYLKNAPHGFLKSRVVTIAGERDGVAEFKLSYGANDSVHDHCEILEFLAPTGGAYTLSTIGTGPKVPMDSVKMHRDVTPSSTLNFIEAKFHTITQDMMTTGQLSGCCFIMRRNVSGAFQCTHIQPNNFGDGNALETFLKGLGLVGNNLTFYGRTDYTYLTQHVSIIGKRNGGIWNVYAQRQDASHSIIQVDNIYLN